MSVRFHVASVLKFDFQSSLIVSQDHSFLFLSYSIVGSFAFLSPTANRAWAMGLSSFPELSGHFFYLRKGWSAMGWVSVGRFGLFLFAAI